MACEVHGPLISRIKCSIAALALPLREYWEMQPWTYRITLQGEVKAEILDLRASDG